MVRSRAFRLARAATWKTLQSILGTGSGGGGSSASSSDTEDGRGWGGRGGGGGGRSGGGGGGGVGATNATVTPAPPPHLAPVTPTRSLERSLYITEGALQRRRLFAALVRRPRLALSFLGGAAIRGPVAAAFVAHGPAGEVIAVVVAGGELLV